MVTGHETASLGVQFDFRICPRAERVCGDLDPGTSSFFAETAGVTVHQVVMTIALEDSRGLVAAWGHWPRVVVGTQRFSEIFCELLHDECVRVEPSVVYDVGINSVLINKDVSVTRCFDRKMSLRVDHAERSIRGSRQPNYIA